jgi:hypothetical protein
MGANGSLTVRTGSHFYPTSSYKSIRSNDLIAMWLCPDDTEVPINKSKTDRCTLIYIPVDSVCSDKLLSHPVKALS